MIGIPVLKALNQVLVTVGAPAHGVQNVNA